MVYRIVSTGPFLAIKAEDGPVISQGVDIRNEKEVLSFMGSFAHEEGLVMNPVRDQHGHLSHIETSIDPAAMRFSFESMRELDRLKLLLSATVRHHAAARAALAGRFLVEDEDIRAALGAALADLARESPAGT